MSPNETFPKFVLTLSHQATPFSVSRKKERQRQCHITEAQLILHVNEQEEVLSPQVYLTTDYYDGGDRYNRGPPRQSLEESVLTRLRKDFISLADPVFPADVY